MDGSGEHGSEVARLLGLIEQEFEAGRNGLSGLASGIAYHRFINQRMENMQRYQKELQNLVGEVPGALMVSERLGNLPDVSI